MPKRKPDADQRNFFLDPHPDSLEKIDIETDILQLDATTEARYKKLRTASNTLITELDTQYHADQNHAGLAAVSDTFDLLLGALSVQAYEICNPRPGAYFRFIDLDNDAVTAARDAFQKAVDALPENKFDKLKRYTANFLSCLATVLKYAAVGAAIGTVVPGVGTAAGAITGAVTGAGSTLYRGSISEKTLENAKKRVESAVRHAKTNKPRAK